MLTITIPGNEQWDSEREEFVSTKETTLKLEHSLVSISKWESKWCIPFLSRENKTLEQTIDYIKCMTLTQNVDPEVYNHLPSSIINEVNKYIDAPMTATWFNEKQEGKGRSREVITSELIYYWMISSNIPFECQKWHLNRLITLIRVCSVKNAPPKKMSKKDIMNRNRALNESRKAQMNSRG